MSQIHIIILFLAVFLIGRAVLAYLLLPSLLAAIRERTLPRIVVRCLEMALDWITLYFASLLLSYYGVIHFPTYYTVILAGLVAAIPWLGVWWRWKWSEQLDREVEADNRPGKDEPWTPHP